MDAVYVAGSRDMEAKHTEELYWLAGLLSHICDAFRQFSHPVVQTDGLISKARAPLQEKWCLFTESSWQVKQ